MKALAERNHFKSGGAELHRSTVGTTLNISNGAGTTYCRSALIRDIHRDSRRSGVLLSPVARDVDEFVRFNSRPSLSSPTLRNNGLTVGCRRCDADTPILMRAPDGHGGSRMSVVDPREQRNGRSTAKRPSSERRESSPQASALRRRLEIHSLNAG